MSILWTGGEDTSFPAGSPATVDITAGRFRSGYARCAVFQGTNGAISKSPTFSAISSGWLTLRSYQGAGIAQSQRTMFGLGVGATNKGIFVGSDSGTPTKVALCKFDGSTPTQLAAEVGTSFLNGVQRFDLQVVGPMSAATLNLFVDGVLLVTYSGDLSATLTTFDSIFVTRSSVISGSYPTVSEIILSDEDTRSFPGLVTLALTSNGTTNGWTNSVAQNASGTSFSDATPYYTNTAAQDHQFNVTDLPSGSFVIRAVKIEARACKSAGSTPTKLKLGVNDGGSVAFGAAPGDQTLTTAYATYEELDQQNPHGPADWDQSIMNALQIDVQSVT